MRASNHNSNKQLHRWLVVVALGLAVYACYQLIAPYIGIVCLAFIFSLLSYPLHIKILDRLNGHKNIASIVSCALLTIVILIPLFFVFAAVLQQAIEFSKNIYVFASSGQASELINHPYLQQGLDFVNTHLPFDPISEQDILRNITNIASSLGKKTLSLSGQILGNVSNFFAHFMLMLFVLFFFLRDQVKLIENFRHILPLSRSHEDKLLNELRIMAKSAVLGSLLTALAQGIAGGLAMGVVGFPALFWGSMIAFASFIPVVGTALIWVPTACYLFLTGDWQWAGIFTLWCIFIVGAIDNFLRPILMQGSSAMSTLVILFALLGGIHLYGLLGIIYGPIIFSLTFVLFRIYEVEFHDFLVNQDKT